MTPSVMPLILSNAQRSSLDNVPRMPWHDFTYWLLGQVESEARISAFFGVPEEKLPNGIANESAAPGSVRLFAVLARTNEPSLVVASTSVFASYPSLTPFIPALHLFERELHEQFNITPLGHPWLKPVRFPHPDGPRAGDTEFFAIDGDEVHEVAVGPIHAGIIECGHFRFQCMGETVLHLEISLGYHHRSVARALTGRPDARTFPLMETIAGDTSIAHTWAACSILEALAGCAVSPRGQMLRAVALELERLANHTGDIGALAGDIGFLPTSSYCGRIRGDFLNMTAELCGNRFGRGLVRPGGTAFDADAALAKNVAERIHTAYNDVRGAADLLWHSTSVTARMLGIGEVTKQTALALGMVGMAARASGVRADARITHPLPHLNSHDVHIRLKKPGDVMARTMIRMREIKESAAFASKVLRHLPEGKCVATPFATTAPRDVPLAPLSISTALVEGWRGEVCHVGLTDEKGVLFHYAVIDPSFHNWTGLAMALRGQQISDFPLCNKSFNLSYCGHDL